MPVTIARSYKLSYSLQTTINKLLEASVPNNQKIQTVASCYSALNRLNAYSKTDEKELFVVAQA